MPRRSDSLPDVSYPFGVRTTRPLQVVMAVVMAAGALTGIVLAFLLAEPWRGIVPLLVVVAGLAIAWRWPYIGLPLVLAAPFISGATGESVVVTWSLVAMGTFVLTLRGARSRYVAPVAALSAYVGEALADPAGFVSPSAYAALAVTFAAAASGSAIREHFRFLHSLEDRAEEAVRTRSVEQAQRVAEERLRIARDLHDVVGHQVAVVSMQIGMAEVALPVDSAPSREALHAAREGVRTILQESQRILAVLRDPSESEEEFAPAPALAQLGELIAAYRAVGVEIDSSIETPFEVTPGVQTTAYRVVQEALTNAQRHGRGTVDVDVTATAAMLTVSVGNAPAERASGEGSGYGLLGMKERVQSVGGRLDVSHTAERFTVTARMPINRTERA